MLRRRLISLLLSLSAASFAADSSFRFSIIGDRTGNPRQEIYAAIWAEVDRLRPDFVINVGDTIQGTSDETVEAQWKEIQDFLAPYRRYPFYFVPGNHDIWSSYSEKVWQRETGRPPSYSFTYGNALFVVLDNSRSMDLPEAQIEFLESELKKNQQRRPKFVFFHQPAWQALALLKDRRGYPLHRLALDYGVDYVVTGHGHAFIRTVIDGVSYMQMGSSGANIGDAWQKDEAFTKGLFYHHTLVEVNGSAARFTVIELGPPYGKARRFDAATWEQAAQPATPR